MLEITKYAKGIEKVEKWTKKYIKSVMESRQKSRYLCVTLHSVFIQILQDNTYVNIEITEEFEIYTVLLVLQIRFFSLRKKWKENIKKWWRSDLMNSGFYRPRLSLDLTVSEELRKRRIWSRFPRYFRKSLCSCDIQQDLIKKVQIARNKQPPKIFDGILIS